MGNVDKDILINDNEIEKLYQIYLRVQSGDKSALNELFKETNGKKICRADIVNKEYRMADMDNVLDSELVLDNDKNEKEEEWMYSVYSKVTFQFLCLNKMLYKKKKAFLSKAKNTGYKNSGYNKFYDGEYDVSDFNELIYETVIEIFNSKTDEDNCLTLDGKKNVKIPICDGISLLKNISYFASRKINKRAKICYLDIYDTQYYNEESETEELSIFDKYALEKFLETEGGISRLTIYTKYLEWLKRHDVYRLFKANACDIRAIIETIMNCENTFTDDIDNEIKMGAGMRLVKQKTLQEIIKFRHNINIEQENISKDMEIIEQRLLDHLFYSLNYRIDKAAKSIGIYEKESERCLCELNERAYIKMFGRTSYVIYNESVNYINGNVNSYNFENYFRIIKRYEDMITDIVSLEKGKKKYDMVNLVLENNDLVDDKTKTLFDIANTVIAYYKEKEKEYINDKLSDYIMKGLVDWEKGYWEAELRDEFIKIKLWSNENVKKPIRHNINREKLMVYCGYMNFYFCNTERKVCYCVPKDRRVIIRANKKYEIFIYNVG